MDPFSDVLGIRAREAQPHMAVVVPTRVEGNAHDIRDLGTNRFGEHRRGVDTFRYLHPYEQTALRVCPTAPDLSLIHISEPTRLGMSSYAVFCLKKKKLDMNQ